jgi:hypothetical protein
MMMMMRMKGMSREIRRLASERLRNKSMAARDLFFTLARAFDDGGVMGRAHRDLASITATFFLFYIHQYRTHTPAPPLLPPPLGCVVMFEPINLSAFH